MINIRSTVASSATAWLCLLMSLDLDFPCHAFLDACIPQAL